MLINTISTHLIQRIENNELTNGELVQLIELIGGYLNLQTIPDYARQFKMSYNGVKNHRPIVELFNVKFIADNE